MQYAFPSTPEHLLVGKMIIDPLATLYLITPYHNI